VTARSLIDLLAFRRSTVFASLFCLTAFAQTILLAVIPLEALRLLGDVQLVSMLYFGVGLVGFLGRLGVPSLTRIIRRPWVFALGAATVLASLALLASDSTAGFALGLALNVLAFTSIEVILTLYVLDQIPRHELGKFEGKRLFFAAAPWTMGPWLGVYLHRDVRPWVPFALAGAAVIALLGSYWIFGSSTNAESRSSRAALRPALYLHRFFSQPRLRLAWILAAGRSIWWNTFFIYGPMLAVTSGLGEQVGGAIVSVGQSWMWVIPLWAWLGRRFGFRRLLTIGYMGAGLFTLATVALMGTPWLGAAMLLLATLTASTIDGAGNSLFLRAVHPYERSEMTAVFVSYRDITQIGPPALFSVLLSAFELPAVFVASGIIMLAMTSLARYIPRRF
jgi:MFS transporter, ACDE family, multidrug resistance protein